MASTPIALFCFNRPAHTRTVLEALANCKDADNHDLHVFIDGPRTEKERHLIDEVAQLMHDLPFRSTQVHRAADNRGLFASITGGISKLLQDHSRIIVLEDDLVVHADFLHYMNDALDRYEAEPRVGCVHGYALPIANLPDYYFLRGGDCWGWATWRDRWARFRPDALPLISELVARGQEGDFMLPHGVQSLRMLCDRATGRNQSWAILWHASLWLEGMLTLNPGKSLVSNIGNDGSGVHCGATTRFDTESLACYAGIPWLQARPDQRASAMVRAFSDRNRGLIGVARNAYLEYKAVRVARKLARPG